jgi:protein-S-isoprenylcysteine O-methyltransferase Ste14
MRWFRQADPTTARWLLLRTGAQIVVFWGLFLFVVPPFIARMDPGAVDVASLRAARVVAGALFFIASALGLASAFAMVRLGQGTPLPVDGARRLVVGGPYALVRNPMAVAGLSQGAAVALWLGSPLVLVYVVTGGVLWHRLVRPIEEAYLLATFGEEYSMYRARVPLWLPRRTRRAEPPR